METTRFYKIKHKKMLSDAGCLIQDTCLAYILQNKYKFKYKKIEKLLYGKFATCFYIPKNDSASVQVAFENGDTTLLLAHVNGGIYTGTWVPWNVGHCNVTITAVPPSWQSLKRESVIINGTVNML